MPRGLGLAVGSAALFLPAVSPSETDGALPRGRPGMFSAGLRVTLPKVAYYPNGKLTETHAPPLLSSLASRDMGTPVQCR